MNFEKRKLGDVCDFVGGSQPPKSMFTAEESEGYIRLIQTRDYKTDNYKTFIPKDSTQKFCSKSDIMIGRYGPPIFQILRGLEGAYNVALMKAIPKNGIRHEYLYYFLKQQHLFEYVDKLSPRTGGQTGVDVPMLKEYPILVPSEGYQIKVENILCSLDSKISLNNRINQELEAMAKLIYDYWFVQFDFPCPEGLEGQEHLAGRPYKSSGGKMVYNEQLKREIPEGWGVKELADIVDTVNDSIDPSNDPNRNFKYYSIPVWDDKKSYELTMGREIGSNKYLVNDKRILVSKLNPWFSRVVFATDNDDTICSTEFVVWQPKTATMKCYLYQIATHPHFIAYSTQNATGTSNSHKRVNPKVMMKYKVAFDERLAISFSEKIKPFIKQMQKNQDQNQKLSELRDWLLPMLMNGQVTVSESGLSGFEDDQDLSMAAEERGEYGEN